MGSVCHKICGGDGGAKPMPKPTEAAPPRCKLEVWVHSAKGLKAADGLLGGLLSDPLAVVKVAHHHFETEPVWNNLNPVFDQKGQPFTFENLAEEQHHIQFEIWDVDPHKNSFKKKKMLGQVTLQERPDYGQTQHCSLKLSDVAGKLCKSTITVEIKWTKTSP
mmetsp:Transcript_37730/g.82903  ORF Transcript_37730/g.82903 Transcript_37730/m.82903 type:complete len:163 (+) Transcript_37730:58-546(+)